VVGFRVLCRRFIVFSSIRARLTLSHLAVILVATALSGFLLLSLVESYFLQAMEDNLAAQARITAQALIPGARLAAPAGEAPPSAFNTVQQQNSNISLQAQNVAPAPAETSLGAVSLSYLADASLQLSSQLETRIRILDAGGVVLVDSLQQEQSANLQGDPLVAQALADNPRSVADYQAGKKAAAGFLVGQVMKLSKGKADPKLVGKLVAEKLADAAGIA